MGETAKQVGNRGLGRKKGVPNKNTAIIKDAITYVYADLQRKSGKEHGHFSKWAEDNPTEYYKLASKLIPIQVGGDPDGAPLIFRTVYESATDAD